jgi:hypothetical protein
MRTANRASGSPEAPEHIDTGDTDMPNRRTTRPLRPHGPRIRWSHTPHIALVAIWS